MDTDSNTLSTVANSDAAPRVVADVRATSGNRGVPKSGRIWKRVRSQRFSQIRNDKPDSTTWQDKLNKKSNHKAIKSFAQELKEEKLERQKAERERIAENKKRKLENEKKNEIVVPVTAAMPQDADAGVSSYKIVPQYSSSLTHLSGRLRPQNTQHRPEPSQEPHTSRQPSEWLPKGFVELPRFEMPINLETLSELTPVDYLAKYCVITSRVKKLLYHRQYTKYKDIKADGIDSLEVGQMLVRYIVHLTRPSTTTYTVYFAMNSKKPSKLLSKCLWVRRPWQRDFLTRVTWNLGESFFYMYVCILSVRLYTKCTSVYEVYVCIVGERAASEADYTTYITLRERQVQLKSRSEQREREQVHQQSLQRAALEKTARKISANVYKDKAQLESELLHTEVNVTVDVSDSEKHLVKEVERNRVKLENKISVTQILELNSRPRKYPKELMEQIDFHGLNYKLKDIHLSPSMERLVRILVSL
ncbi:hypothetical protein EB796_014146 [Bugula neritina]|uniref:Coiled-coil domain-containing protein 86 n=1 Tax=Bugula neritina TaxID=10212 RepID=A0A7J7JMH8_BUGNE|nr:hypothetical protein EB796_014146 [Bugula neritina]